MIKVNNTEYYNGIVQNKRTINFTVDNLDKKQELTITLINKSLNKDTVLKDGKIVMDKLVKIEKIVLDEVNIKENIFEATYKPIYPFPVKTLLKVTALGYNGTWTFCYENSPVHYFAKKRQVQSMFSVEKGYVKLDDKKYLDLIR